MSSASIIAARASGLQQAAAKQEGERKQITQKKASELYKKAASAEPDGSKKQLYLRLAELNNVNQVLAKTNSCKISNINFDNVGGLESVKEQIGLKIIEPFNNPDIYKRHNLKAGGAIMLYGPPGTGKTLIARATAGECGASFFPVKTSSILGSYVGESERNLSEIFGQARQAEKAIIFFDEFEAIASPRGSGAQHSDRLVTEFLAQLDGADSNNKNILILAATNCPWMIDGAITRSGRFSSSILISKPDQKAREQIFNINLKGRPVASEVSIKELSRLSEGFSGADIAEVCNQAAYSAVSRELQSGKNELENRDDFIKAAGEIKINDGWLLKAREEIKKRGMEELFTELF